MTDPIEIEQSYRRGYQDGYEAAEAAANRSWRDGATWRPGLTEVDVRYVTIDGKREAVLSWRDRKAADLATLAEAHAAGLHAEAPSIRCPACGPATPAVCVHPFSDVSSAGVCRGCGACLTITSPRCICSDTGRDCPAHEESPLHHRGHYGVPAVPEGGE
jgi:hypothetical protein